MEDFALWFLAFAIIVHTIAEAWLPEYQRVKPNWQAVLFNRNLFLDNLPIFISVLIIPFLGWRFPIISGILPAIGISHPILDHMGLSYQTKALRPGSLTGIFLMLPISLWIYLLHVHHPLFSLPELLISSLIGLGISLGLYWLVLQELKNI